MGIIKRHLSHRENQKNQKPKNKNERKFIRNENKTKQNGNNEKHLPQELQKPRKSEELKT